MTKRSGKVVQLVPADGARPTLAHSMALFNATRHGVMSRHTVMPWEDRGEYQELVDALVTEYAPAGPTERHLVEEVASVMWRRPTPSASGRRPRAIRPRQPTPLHTWGSPFGTRM